MGPFPKLAYGEGSIKVASRPQTLIEMIKSVQHFNPNAPSRAAPTFGTLKGFKPVRIPVVFHCE
jgi:hypothetical protein